MYEVVSLFSDVTFLKRNCKGNKSVLVAFTSFFSILLAAVYYLFILSPFYVNFSESGQLRINLATSLHSHFHRLQLQHYPSLFPSPSSISSSLLFCHHPSVLSCNFNDCIYKRHRFPLATQIKNKINIDFNSMLSSLSTSSISLASSGTKGQDAHRNIFTDKEEYERYLEEEHATLPDGFRVGSRGLSFRPVEVPTKSSILNVTLITMDEPSDQFAAMFTKNAFPGAPIYVGRQRRENRYIQSIVINNKVSNVCPGGDGIADAERTCEAVAEALKLSKQSLNSEESNTNNHNEGSNLVIPSSTGVIGWRLPIDAIVEVIPDVVSSLQSQSVLPAAKGIMTTDRYAKIRSCTIEECSLNEEKNQKHLYRLNILGKETQYFGVDNAALLTKENKGIDLVPINSGRIVGIAKGAGMIEPNMATMLVYILTDISIPRDLMRDMLQKAVANSFNTISVDSDESTSDTIVLLSSKKKDIFHNLDSEQKKEREDENQIHEFHDPQNKYSAFFKGLQSVCKDLAEDVVRNGEGTNHVIEVKIRNAPTYDIAVGVGRSIVNSPLFKCAVAGNDPNVGRLIAAVGKYIGNNNLHDLIDVSKCTFSIGGEVIFSNNKFALDDEKENRLIHHFQRAVISPTKMTSEAMTKVDFPPHENNVQVDINLAADRKDIEDENVVIVYGSDLTYDYVTENADYRS